MTPARSAMVAMLALLLIATLPVAGAEEQYPRGLMSVEPTAPQGGRTCTIDVRPMSFGIYDPLAAAPLDALGQVIYVCGNLDDRAKPEEGNKTIRIEMTTGTANTFSPRGMFSGPTDRLDYNIYLDATRTTIWGQGAFGTDIYVDSNPPNKTPVTVPAFGRVRQLQDVPEGQYVDVVTVRILF
jgi:spore coat protein U-like protein